MYIPHKLDAEYRREIYFCNNALQNMLDIRIMVYTTFSRNTEPNLHTLSTYGVDSPSIVCNIYRNLWSVADFLNNLSSPFRYAFCCYFPISQATASRATADRCFDEVGSIRINAISTFEDMRSRDTQCKKCVFQILFIT